MSPGPWGFDVAQSKSEDAAREQERLEEEVRDAYREHARAERSYNVALARRIWELKREGIAITACERLAKGDETIADLRERRDMAEGSKETAKLAAWRANADRRDITGLIDWSMRRDMAEFYGRTQEPDWSRQPVIGARGGNER